MGKNVSNNISKNLNGKYSQIFLDHAKLKTASKKVIRKTVEATDDLIGNKIADVVALRR